jgi:hypothetical protein
MAVLVVRLVTYWSFLIFAGLVTLAAGFREILPRLNQVELRHAVGEQRATALPADTSGPLPAATGGAVSES